MSPTLDELKPVTRLTEVSALVISPGMMACLLPVRDHDDESLREHAADLWLGFATFFAHILPFIEHQTVASLFDMQKDFGGFGSDTSSGVPNWNAICSTKCRVNTYNCPTRRSGGGTNYRDQYNIFQVGDYAVVT